MNNEAVASQDRTAVDVSLLVVRVVAGVIFAAHGWQKLVNLSAMVAEPPAGMGLLGYPVTIGEFFGGLGLIVGFLTRFSAASLIVIMIGAIAMVHGQHGFFLGQSAESTLGEAGFEYNVALIGLLAPTLVAGPGKFAIGRFVPFLVSKRTGRPILALE